MTWWFYPDGGQMDVFDHDGTQVASGREQSGWSEDEDGNVTEPPAEVYDVMRENMEGTQPSAYNQSALADAATDNIEKGTPP